MSNIKEIVIWKYNVTKRNFILNCARYYIKWIYMFMSLSLYICVYVNYTIVGSFLLNCYAFHYKKIKTALFMTILWIYIVPILFKWIPCRSICKFELSIDALFFWGVTNVLDLTCEKWIERLEITFAILTPLGSNIIIFHSVSSIVVFSFPMWLLTCLAWICTVAIQN